MANNEAIEQAISDLNAQEAPNVRATAKKYDLIPSTLMRRFKQETVSRSEGQSKFQHALNQCSRIDFYRIPQRVFGSWIASDPSNTRKSCY